MMVAMMVMVMVMVMVMTKPVYHDHQMLVDAVGVFLPNDPEGNAKLVFSILDCLPKANRVSFIIVRN